VVLLDVRLPGRRQGAAVGPGGEVDIVPKADQHEPLAGSGSELGQGMRRHDHVGVQVADHVAVGDCRAHVPGDRGAVATGKHDDPGTKIVASCQLRRPVG